MTDRYTRTFWLLIALIIAVAAAARLLPGPRTIDDAFITFRYSRNLIDGLGFVYNSGVATLGTSTPLWALILAGGGALGLRDFPLVAPALSAGLDAANCVILFLLARRAIGRDWLAALPALCYAISPMSVTFAIGGMETSLNVFWMLAASALFVLPPADTSIRRRRWIEAAIGLCYGFGFLTRADAVLWIALLIAGQCVAAWRQRRIPWATAAGALVILLPWAAFSTLTFGSPIPNSVTAKRSAYLVAPFEALAGLLRTYSNLFFAFDLLGSIGTMLSAVVVLATSLMALVFTARHLPRLLPLLIYPWLYLAVFSALNPLMFRWYFAPPLAGLIIGVFVGLWAFVRPLERTRAPWLASAIVGVFGILCLVTTASAWTLHPDHGPDRPAPKMAWHQIELLYAQMARALVEQYGVTPETRVASADIGAIGYYTGARIVDTVGLVTPELGRYYPVDPALIPDGQNYAIPPRLILETQPDFLVTMEAFVRQGLAVDPAFTGAYRLLEEIPTGFYGTGMQLWGRDES